MLIGSIVSAKSFTWFKGCGSAEISDFNGSGANFFGQLYDDACDQGFRCVGKDGHIIPFYLEYTQKDDEGDIQAWVFRPVPMGLREAGIRINLFND